ncbi:MAG TPA: glycosyltransferase [Chryseosolibacter sp.]
MKKRVLFVLPTLHAGGAENYTLRFIRYFREDYDFSVMSLQKEKGDLHELFLNAGVRIHYNSLGYLDPIKWIRFFRFIKTGHFDVVCTMNGNFGGIPILISRLAGVRQRVAFYRRSTTAFSLSRLRLLYNQFVRNLVYRHATDILSNSAFAFKTFFIGLPQDQRFKVIPNGVEATQFDVAESQGESRALYRLPEEYFIIGHVGRFDPAKNHEFICKVARRLIKNQALVMIVFCGKHTDSQKFIDLLHSFGLQGHYRTLGLQENVAQVLRTFDLFLFPSQTEGQPNALIEAMLAGLPILASNIEPIKEATPESFHQRLIPITDDALVADLITRLIADRTLLQDYKLQSFAKDYYNEHRNFSIFKTIINS